jgi:cellulose synthase operon protein C
MTMRNHRFALLLGVSLAAMPAVARADALADARAAIQKGDLRAAQVDLRSAVRSDPQNAEAHFWLAKVSLDLGDAVAAEREATAARGRGFDAHQSVPLLAQALLAQGKFKDLLTQLQPEGKDATLDAAILVARGYAQIGLKDTDEAKKSFALAEKTAPNAVEPLLASARLAASSGDIATALDKVDQAINAQPKSPDALLLKSELLRTKGDLNGSLSILNQMLTDSPGNLRALIQRAGILIAVGQQDKAKADLDAILKATPGNIQAIYMQAVIQAQAGDIKGADGTLDKIAAYIGRIPRGYFLEALVKEKLGQLEQAEEAARRYIGRAPNDLAAYKVLARIQFAKHRPDLVIETLGKVVAADKGDAETFDLLGRAYAAVGRGDDSVKAFQKAETLAPNDVGLQTRLASARIGMGHPETAVDDLEHTLQLAPTQPRVGEALFFATLATGDLKKAADTLDKIRAAQGDTPIVGNLQGLLKLAQLDVNGAADAFSAVLKKHPDFTPAKVNLARVAALQGNNEQAEKYLSEILQASPASEPALGMLVTQMAQTGRMPQAIALMEKAHAAEPRNPRLTATLGELYIRSKKADQALDLATKDKTNANTLEMLGLKAMAQLALDQKDQAIDTFGAILKLDPTLLTQRRQLETLLLQKGDYENVRNVIKAGLAASPRNYQLYQDYVMVDLKDHGVDAALSTADQLIAQDRDFQPARALKGDIYMAANKPEDAAKAYQDALATAPSTMLITRASAAMIRAGQADAAAKLLTDWIGTHPDDVFIVQQLSDLDIAAHRYDDAVKHLEAIIAKQPHNAVALNNLAWLYQQRNDPRAETMAQQAYILSPNGQTADTLGWILIASGKTGEAVPLLRQAASQAGNDPRVLYHFAVALKDSGQKDQAIKVLNVVVENKAEFGEKSDAQKLLTELTKGS